MKNFTLFSRRVIFFFICCLTTVAIFGQDSNFEHKKDSLKKVIASTQGKEKLEAYEMLAQQMFYYENDIDTILVFYKKWEKEAEKQKDVKLQGNIKYFTLAVLANRDREDIFLTLIYPYLDFLKKHERWQYYDYLQNALFRIYIRQGKNLEAIQQAKALYEETKQSNRKEGMAVAHRMLAFAYGNVGRFAESEENAKISIEILESLEYPHQLLQDAYIVWVDALNFQKKYAEAVNALKLWEKACDKMGINAVAMYDFYWISAIVHIDMGDLVTGEKYMLKADSIETEHFSKPRFSRDLFWAKIKEGRKEYSQALDLINASYSDEDILNNIEILPVKARILCKMERGEEAYLLYERLQVVQDSLNKNYFNVQLDEIRTQYEVDKHITEKIRNRNYFLFALGGCVLLLIALGIWIYLNRKITRKNRVLVQQIKELTAFQEAQDQELLTKTTFVSEEEKAETIDDELRLQSRMDKLCITIRDLLLKDKIYRNPAITQELVIETIGTNRRTFSEAFEYCFKMQFKDYINLLRMKDAILLLDKSDLSIEEIADTAGFGTVRTFQRQFSAKYNMSPKEYRGAMNTEG